jgi:putative acetyltransferase
MMEPQLKEQALAPISSEIIVVQDDISRPEVAALFDAHFTALNASSKANKQIGRVPDLSTLQNPRFTIFTARSIDSNELMGCAALKRISSTCGELKSMRTAAGYQRKGVAGALIKHIVDVARNRDYKQLRLETGAREEFAAARALYSKFGFVPCGPFEGYEDAVDISIFMTYDIK